MMAPMKGEESETQRSARARHARATRRSTQGVSQDELQEAKKLLQTDPARPAPPATSDAKPVEEKAAERSTMERTAPERSTTERTAPERAVRDHNGTSAGTDSTDGQLREAPKQEKSSDPTSSTVSPEVTASQESWQFIFCFNLFLLSTRLARQDLRQCNYTFFLVAAHHRVNRLLCRNPSG